MHASLAIRDTMKVVQDIAKPQGYVRTIGGRYQHKPKPQYDPATGKVNDFIYKMLNKLIQGSAADILKFALLTAWDSGVFDVLKMHLTVHDENVVSVPFSKAGTEACVELQNIMDNSFKDVLKVPMKACCELGPNWGYWSGDIFDEMKKGNFDPGFLPQRLQIDSVRKKSTSIHVLWCSFFQFPLGLPSFLSSSPHSLLFT